MNPMFLNAALLPLIATLVIPEVLRDRKTGEFRGFGSPAFLFVVIVLLALESYFLIGKFGFSGITMLRAFAITALPVAGGILFMVYSHKENFGRAFRFSKREGS